MVWAFYCHKCYSALSDMENACWACDSVLDKRKPVKSVKKEEELEGIEPDMYKKVSKS